MHDKQFSRNSKLWKILKTGSKTNKSHILLLSALYHLSILLIPPLCDFIPVQKHTTSSRRKSDLSYDIDDYNNDDDD